ncbi:helix-turn-helix transcriptional regulator [Carnobacterium maltaromaticum]|uniref:helix-turn-helix transcriptional regulator n=1 Tax=Carnobacterium maltaromaticum TaxID=2751 RepID=UPI0022B09EB9|nr:helix-turn-helix transcriptional regulator [Carnobacterium maltaromaticum]
MSIIVKKRRKELKMSQVELAKDICTQGTISNIEKYRGLPSTEIISALAEWM